MKTHRLLFLYPSEFKISLVSFFHLACFLFFFCCIHSVCTCFLGIFLHASDIDGGPLKLMLKGCLVFKMPQAVLAHTVFNCICLSYPFLVWWPSQYMWNTQSVSRRTPLLEDLMLQLDPSRTWERQWKELSWRFTCQKQSSIWTLLLSKAITHLNLSLK